MKRDINIKDLIEKPDVESKCQWVLVMLLQKLEKNVPLAILVPLAKFVLYLWHLS